MRITPDLLARHIENPMGTDAEIRAAAKIPSDRYYTVATFPPSRAGVVEIGRTREVHAKKISKSDQPPKT